MKIYFTLFLSFTTLYGILIAQQSGIINYQETVKLNIEIEGMMDEGMADLLPDSRTINMQLDFDGKNTLYKEGQNENLNHEISSDDGSMQIMIMTSDIEDILFIDHSDKRIVNQSGFMGRTFLIKDKLPKIKWRVTSEKISYLDYECIKATTKNAEGKDIIAWFAPDIPLSIGPDVYGQLPGAILMLSVDGDEREIKATKILFSTVDNIEEPSEGKEVTEQEFDKIMDDKMKEMELDHGDGEFIIKRG